MSAWRHAGISCDDCGELFCCHYESVIETREQASCREGWERRSMRRADGRFIWRDVCASCAERSDR